MPQFLVATLINRVNGSTEPYLKNLFSYSIFKVRLKKNLLVSDDKANLAQHYRSVKFKIYKLLPSAYFYSHNFFNSFLEIG
jgi:hypothetical protein